MALMLIALIAVVTLICFFIFVDCSKVAESMNAFLSEYNSQYIHDDVKQSGGDDDNNDGNVESRNETKKKR